MDISEVNRQVIYRTRSAGSIYHSFVDISAIYRIHSEGSDFDYFGICCSVAFAFVNIHIAIAMKQRKRETFHINQFPALR